jgi:hypothetical protein
VQSRGFLLALSHAFVSTYLPATTTARRNLALSSINASSTCFPRTRLLFFNFQRLDHGFLCIKRLAFSLSIAFRLQGTKSLECTSTSWCQTHKPFIFQHYHPLERFITRSNSIESRDNASNQITLKTTCCQRLSLHFNMSQTPEPGTSSFPSVLNHF